MKKWNPDPVEQLENGTWIFWNETWADWHGPFMSEEECRKELETYASSLFLEENANGEEE